jgi:hypothetical protein
MKKLNISSFSSARVRRGVSLLSLVLFFALAFSSQEMNAQSKNFGIAPDLYPEAEAIELAAKQIESLSADLQGLTPGTVAYNDVVRLASIYDVIISKLTEGSTTLSAIDFAFMEYYGSIPVAYAVPNPSYPGGVASSSTLIPATALSAGQDVQVMNPNTPTYPFALTLYNMVVEALSI